MKRPVTNEDTDVSRREAIQKLAGLGFAAAAAGTTPSPIEAQPTANPRFDTVNGNSPSTALKSTPGGFPGQTAFVEGYSLPADGGAGLYLWDPAALEPDNGITVIRPPGANGTWRRIAGDSFNVRWFGAKGDGRTDDTVAIQNAINTALNQAAAGNGSAAVLFPAGKYAINTFRPANNCRLLLDNAHGGKIHLFGNGDATLFSSTVNPSLDDAMLTVSGSRYTDVLIENLTFQRNPVSTAVRPTLAISLQGGSATARLLRPIVKNCVFKDFSTAVWLTYTEGALVSGCRWLYTDGRSCGSPGPCIGLRAFAASNTQVLDNYWCGTENLATAPNQSPAPSAPMDGFLWGYSAGWVIKNNIVRRGAWEGIATLTNPEMPTGPCIIEGNQVDMDVGFLDRKTVGHRHAIQADNADAVVKGNIIRNSRVGIALQNAYAAAGAIILGGTVAGNSVEFDPMDANLEGLDTNDGGLTGIVIGSRRGVVVESNRLYFPLPGAGRAPTTKETDRGMAGPASGVLVSGSTDVKVLGNVVHADLVSKGKGSPYGLCGVYLDGSSGTLVSGNSFKNLGFGVATKIVTNWGFDTYSRVDHNEYINVQFPLGSYSAANSTVPEPLWLVGASECIVELPANTAPGWYRVFQARAYISGTLRVAGTGSETDGWWGKFPAQTVAAEFRLDYDGSGVGTISQLMASGQTSQYISQLRVSQASRNRWDIGVDVYVTKSFTGKIRLIFLPDDRFLEPAYWPSAAAVPAPVASTSDINKPITWLISKPGISTTGRLIVGDGIGGTLVDGQTSGNVVKKIPVYNSNGTLAGYLPVYQS